MTFRTVTIAMLAMLLLSGCGGGKDEARDEASADRAPAAAATAAAPARAELESATLQGIKDLPAGITLSAGQWEGEPAAEGGASRPSVTLARGLHLAGDLDGDGVEEAVALAAAHHGGTGELIHLVVFKREGDGVRNVATAPVGDRVQVRTARVEAGLIVLGVVQAGPEDAMCCPGETAERAWVFENGALREEPSPAPRGRLSLADLAGVTWVLRAWSWNEPAGEIPEVSFTVEGGNMAGSAGCNRFMATLTPGASPGDVTVGARATTRMACPQPADSVETRFLAQMGAVNRYSFMATQLALTYRTGDRFGTMLFEARRP
jgi:heat shock protein HslJ